MEDWGRQKDKVEEKKIQAAMCCVAQCLIEIIYIFHRAQFKEVQAIAGFVFGEPSMEE
jgi:hypothetical protein